MLEARRIETNIQPEKFQSLGNNTFYYNFDIQHTKVMVEHMYEGDPYEEDRWNFIQVLIEGKPTYTKCVTAIIREYISQDKEMALVNEYASKTLNIEDADSKEYIEYLSLIADIKYRVGLDFGMVEEKDPLEEAKKKVVKAIDDYDVSMEVNSFFLNGLQVWLDKSTRVGLMNSLNIEKTAGKEISTLWFGNIKLDINTEAAIQMLSALELYALECYNKTAEHKGAVETLTSLEAVENYDYTTGYPTKLNFTIE